MSASLPGMPQPITSRPVAATRRSRRREHFSLLSWPGLMFSPAMTTSGSLPRVADQRLFPAANHEQQDAEAAKQAPARRRQDGDHHRVPQDAAGIGLDQRLELRQTARIDELSQRPHVGEVEVVGRDRFGAVIDHQDKGGGQADQAYKAEQETDHKALLIRSITPI